MQPTAVRYYLIIRNIIIIIATGNVNEPVCDQNYHITFEFDDFIWLTIGRAQPFGRASAKMNFIACSLHIKLRECRLNWIPLIARDDDVCARREQVRRGAWSYMRWADNFRCLLSD